MSTLKIALLQTQTCWHDPAANRSLFEALLERVPSDCDLVLLPEMFSTGFTMASQTQAEPMTGPTPRWLSAMAARYQCTLAGSVVIKEAGRFFNRLLWAAPGEPLGCYDKRHLFRMAGEHQHYAPGSVKAQFELNGFRIRPLICYDLRFPVWSRNDEDYDLLLYLANWPAARGRAWRTLLPARAIENGAYVAAVNVLGIDGNGVRYAGDSGAWHPDGRALVAMGADRGVSTVTLSLPDLMSFRDGFPAHQDRDAFTLNADNVPSAPQQRHTPDVPKNA